LAKKAPSPPSIPPPLTSSASCPSSSVIQPDRSRYLAEVMADPLAEQKP
jgi:hypothetical protein